MLLCYALIALGLYADALGTITRGNVWRGDVVVNNGFVKTNELKNNIFLHSFVHL